LSHYWNFLRIDLMLWLFAFLAFFIYRNIEPIQLKSSQKLSAKIIRNTQEVNS
ncbi:MAG TPA: peptidase, partial [Acinetobacter radioresistens]|nr:peptidase [Acinetobacter radioresistens]